MAFTFTLDDARLLFGLIASVIVPFVTSWLKRAAWSPTANLALAILVSGVAAVLSQFVAGALIGTPTQPVSIVAALIGVFFAGQTHYVTWFKSLQVDERLNPPTASASAERKVS